MSSRVYATGHIKDPVPLIEKRKWVGGGLSPFQDLLPESFDLFRLPSKVEGGPGGIPRPPVMVPMSPPPHPHSHENISNNIISI